MYSQCSVGRSTRDLCWRFYSLGIISSNCSFWPPLREPYLEHETDLSLEDMMEEYYDKMEDRENEVKESHCHTPLALSCDSSNVDINITKEKFAPKGKSLVTDVAQNVPSNQIEDANSVNSAPEVDVEVIKNEADVAWRAEHVATEWGTSDDVVTIGNGRSYYYFKIPHKVCVCLRLESINTGGMTSIVF